MSSQGSEIYRFGPFEMDARERRFLRDGHPVRIRAKVFDTLRMLVENRGRLVAKEELIQAIWPDSVVEENNLAHNITALRKALGESATGQKYIETVPGFGYRFVAEVTLVEPEPEKPLPKPNAPVVLPKRRRLLPLMIPVAAVCAIALFLALRAREHATPDALIDSLAVLPFLSLSSDPEVQHFADGVTDEVTANLAQIPGLRVPSRTAMFRYKHQVLDVGAVGKEVGARAILEGSVRRDGERYLITAQLIDSRDGYHLWAETYDQTAADSLSLQRETAARIARALRERTLGERPWRAEGREVDQDVLERYLRAQMLQRESASQAHLKGGVPEALREALSLLEEVTRERPSFARGWADLAGTAEYAYMLDPSHPPELLETAKAAARKALEIDDTLPEAYAVLASLYFYRERDLVKAEQAARRAIELNPRDVLTMRRYADLLRIQGRFSDARVEIDRALMLQPAEPYLSAQRALLLYDANDYEAAIRQADHSAAVNDAREPRSYSFAIWIKGLCYERLGRLAEAEEQFRLGLAHLPHDSRNEPALGHVLGRMGRSEEARSVVRSLEEKLARGRLNQYGIALVHCGLGEHEIALNWLEAGLRNGDESVLFLHLDKRFEPMREHPRFQKLLAR